MELNYINVKNNPIKFYVNEIGPIVNEEQLRDVLSYDRGSIELGEDIIITETEGQLDIGRCVTIHGSGFEFTGDLIFFAGADGAVLKDMEIDGNIIINVGDTGSVTLDNVVLDKNHSIIVISGGVNSVHLKGVESPVLNIEGTCRVCLEESSETGDPCVIGNINMGSSSLNSNSSPSGERILEAVKAEITNINIYSFSQVVLAQADLPMEGEYDATVDSVNVYGVAYNTDVAVNSRGLIRNLDINANETEVTVNTGGKVENMTVNSNNSTVIANTGGEITKLDIEGNRNNVEVNEESKIGEIYIDGDSANITGQGTTKIVVGPDANDPPSVEGCIITGSVAAVSDSIALNYALGLSDIDTINMSAGTYYTDYFEIKRPITITGANYEDDAGNYITQTIVKVTIPGSSTIVYIHDCENVILQGITFDRDEKAGIAVLFYGGNDFNNSKISHCKVIGTPGETASNQFCALEALNFVHNIIFEENIVVGFHSEGYSAGIGSVWGCQNIIIRNNIIDGLGTGENGALCIASGSAEVTGNNITGCKSGIYQNQVNMNIENNVVHDNAIGVQAWPGSFNLSMKKNKIYDNIDALVGNDGIDASENYWGTNDITTVEILGDILYAPYYLNEEMTELSIPVETITVTSEGNVDTIAIGETLQMNVTVLPENATIKAVEWSVQDKTETKTGEASIDETGILTGEAAGTVVVKSRARDGSRIEGSKEITLIDS